MSAEPSLCEKVWEQCTPSSCAQEGSLAPGSAMSMVSEKAVVRAQASAPSLLMMPEWEIWGRQDALSVMGVDLYLYGGNVSLPLLECHKNTHNFCSGDGISRPMAIGFDVQLQ
eukprot:549622-Pelagomonas_calceolata.AAC.1